VRSEKAILRGYSWSHMMAAGWDTVKTAIPKQHAYRDNWKSSLTSQLLRSAAIVDVEDVGLLLLHALAVALGSPLCNDCYEEVH